MTSQPPHQLRVAAPTLEPDDALLALLVEASTSSSPASVRTGRSAGFRMLLAAASVAAIAMATWAGGQDTATPLKPIQPASQTPTSSPTTGDVGTPQPDVTTPGSPMSPGLPGTTSPDAQRGVDRTGLPGNSADHRRDERGDAQRAGKGKGQGTTNRPRLSDREDRERDDDRDDDRLRGDDRDDRERDDDRDDRNDRGERGERGDRGNRDDRGRD